MSLDVYLYEDATDDDRARHLSILIREDGEITEISREEWDERFPGQEPVVSDIRPIEQVYWRNITHNVGAMAKAAGVYQHLWRPDEIGIVRASQLIEPLQAGLDRLKADPGRFAALNPPNGWGSYGGLIEFIEDYLAACEQHPDARVSVSR
jgi:hypothetical protein